MTVLSAFSNASDIIRANIAVATLSNNIQNDLGGLDDAFDHLLTGEVVGTPTLSSTQISMSFAGGGSLLVTGSGFLGSAPVVTSVRLGSDAAHFLRFTGSLSLGLNAETISGAVTSLTYQTPSFSATLNGSMSLFIGDPDGPGPAGELLRLSGSLTSLSSRSGGIAVDVAGSITFNSQTDEIAGAVTSINVSDSFGGFARLSGIAVPVESLSGLLAAGDVLDLALAGNDVLTADLLGGARLNGQGGNDSITGGRGNDVLRGGEGNDTILGASGNDSLDGETGADTLDGGAGNDTLIGGIGNDVLNAGAGNDTLAGNAGDDTLNGGAGNDNMMGGAGNDVYVVDVAADIVSESLAGAAGGLADTVQSSASFTLGVNVENLALQGGANLSGTGNELANRITGNTGANSLTGGAGDDTLDGGVGADTMVGGSGNDTYVVDNVNDVTTETEEDTGDVVVINRTASLADVKFAGIEHMTLSGAAAIGATGNDGDNILTGNAGANTLNGGAGNDTLIGGAGADTYVVDSSDDVVQETIAGAAGGVDLVNASASFTLSANVENLTLLGSGNLSGIGNAERNVITGNGGNNLLSGLGANDTLTGNAGDDTLDGGTGNDNMAGGAGNDLYIVDSTADIVSETLAGTAGGLADLVQSTASFTLGLNVENLELQGSANVNGTGNASANTITGNDANNLLSGAGGNDTLDGGNGNDTLDGGAGNDSLSGGFGNDTLDGGTGSDTLIGGYGDDLFVLDSTGDVMTEEGGIDTARVLFNAPAPNTIITLGTGIFTGIEHVTVVGAGVFHLAGDSANNALTGNGSANSLTGGAGDDTLDGGVGADTMVGGSGNDTYVVDNLTDVVTEAAGDSSDTLVINRSATLLTGQFQFIEHLTLTGSAATATGNAANNILTGNAGANTLDGGAGNDTLIGGAGADTYLVDSSGDQVLETIAGAAGGVDLVNASASFTLSANVENLTLLGSGNLSGIGNAERNVITGNAGNNALLGAGGNDTLIGNGGNDSLDGGTGNDSLVGGAGNDLYVVDSTTDIVSETLVGADAGFIDTVQSSVSWTLGANLENLQLTGSGNINGTGNVLGNAITGNAGNNLLLGLDGNDSINGMDGNDTIRGGSRGDILSGGDGNDALFGDTGDDVLYGDAGDDTLDGGNAHNQLWGGAGNDTYVVHSFDDQIFEFGPDSGDTLVADMPTSVIFLGAYANVENVVLAGLASAAFGTEGANRLTGNDIGNYLSGGGGDDTLAGMGGHDTLTGGTGADTFVFGAPDEAGNVETIVDFEAGTDTIALSTIFFGGLEPGTLASYQFLSGETPVAEDDFPVILYETGSGNLYYDADGNGAGDRVLIAVLQGSPGLGADDIVVV